MSETREVLRVAVLGAGGLGAAATRMLATKREMTHVAIADSRGYAFDADGLDAGAVADAQATTGTVGSTPGSGVATGDAIGDLLRHAADIDGVFIALPNLPNDFVPTVVERFARHGYQGVMVDALKRTSAAELVVKLDLLLAHVGITYVVGGGATPGLLTAAAAVAAQSFAEVHSVDINFGVGIANWETYRATIREDIAHMPGYDVDAAQRMTDDEVQSLLDETGGILELRDMEHADDIILELAGVVDRKRVTVGGIVDTRNPSKPVSTTVTVTGATFDGRVSAHTFTLGDETSMAANVCGPAFGYMKAAHWLSTRGVHGVLSSADVMPRFVR
ncbi:saccharopine dehydrogenase-like oxidoreductase [Candidatus Poribacteria bacterium]|nr:saccharopine dehydrogenase-like oxidoreductase [Candidatus Poribacteria bacterium]